MCVSPVRFRGRLVSCRLCWQCRGNRIRDYVGRVMAEAHTADASVVLSLTYSEVGPGSVLLLYSDVQNFLKRLRKDFNVRYLVAGEFGSLKGRAHWHICLFFRGAVPAFTLCTEKWSWGYWPHGFTWADELTPKGAKYVCKYLLKDLSGDAGEQRPGLSKKPILGAEFLTQLAASHVRQGLAPQTPYYRVPKGGYPSTIHKGKVQPSKDYYLSGQSFLHFVGEFVRLWALAYPDAAFPASEMLDKFFFGRTVPDERFHVEGT